MITYRHGNLFDVKSGIIVHGCNARGVMGSGVAKAYKELYPMGFEQYVRDVRNFGSIAVGQNSIYKERELVLVSAITQENYGNDKHTRYVSYDGVDLAFRKLKWMIDMASPVFLNVPVNQVHIPKIGAGLGNGDWLIISTIIEQAMGDTEVVCWIQ